MIRRTQTFYSVILATLLLATGLRAQNPSLFAGGALPSGPGTTTNLPTPYSVAVDTTVATPHSGNTYVALPNYYLVVKIDTSGNVTVFAGTGYQWVSGFANGDGGQATSALLNSPAAGALASSGNVNNADGLM